jgi:hypothetical protein
LLRQTPSIKIPRSFVIRQADLEAQRPARRRLRLMATQWATAVAALLFVLVLGADLLTGARLPVAQVAAPAQGGETTRTQALAVEEEMPSAKRLEGTPQASPAEPAGEGELPMRMVVTTTLEAEAPVEKAVPERAGSVAEGTPTAAAEVMLAQPESELSKETPEIDALSVPPAENEATTDVQATEETLSAAPEETIAPTASPVVEEYGSGGERSRLAWRVAEVVLGLVAVALVVIVVWMRRQP